MVIYIYDNELIIIHNNSLIIMIKNADNADKADVGWTADARFCCRPVHVGLPPAIVLLLISYTL